MAPIESAGPAERAGEYFIFSHAVLWSFFPIVSILSFRTVPPLYVAAVGTLVAGVFFAILLSTRHEWSQLLNRSVWRDLLLLTLINGVAYYGLIFVALHLTTAGNASIMGLMEIFFSMGILRLLHKEYYTHGVVFGALFMALGAAIILSEGDVRFHLGDMLIVAATILPPFGNYVTRRARAQVSSTVILFVRSVLGGFILLVIARIFSVPPTSGALISSLPYIIVNGVLFLGLAKVFWIESIHRMVLTKALALNSLAPALTMFFAYYVLAETPSTWQLLGVVPMMVGVWLLTGFRGWTQSTFSL